MKKTFMVDEEVVEVDILHQGENELRLKVGEEEFHFQWEGQSEGKLYLSTLMGPPQKFSVCWGERNQGLHLSSLEMGGAAIISALEKKRTGKGQGAHHDHGGFLSPMPGKILKVLVKEGQLIEKNQKVLVMEAMKMEHEIRSREAGVVEKIFFKEGELVQGGVELVKMAEIK